ncbi:MAG: hypothetical protein ACM3X6_02795 [Patescibacteria group bacterium]
MITVEGVSADPIRAVWETDLRLIACLEITYHGDAEIDLQDGQAMPAVAIGEPGNLQKLAGYTIHRVHSRERIVVLAHEFGGAWRDRNRALFPGPRESALRRLLGQHGESVDRIDAPGGQQLYAQHESDVAFLHRLAASTPVWRDGQGRVNISAPPRVEVQDVIDYRPAAGPTRRYVAAGITPDGDAFEVAAGAGQTVRVAEVFHSPAEARDHIERLVRYEARGRLTALGQAGVRAGCTVILPDGQEHLVTRAVHEVVGASWKVTCSLV